MSIEAEKQEVPLSTFLLYGLLVGSVGVASFFLASQGPESVWAAVAMGSWIVFAVLSLFHAGPAEIPNGAKYVLITISILLICLIVVMVMPGTEAERANEISSSILIGTCLLYGALGAAYEAWRSLNATEESLLQPPDPVLPIKHGPLSTAFLQLLALPVVAQAGGSETRPDLLFVFGLTVVLGAFFFPKQHSRVMTFFPVPARSAALLTYIAAVGIAVLA